MTKGCVCYDDNLEDTCNSYHKKFKKKLNSFTINIKDEPDRDELFSPRFNSYSISENPLFGPSMVSSSASNGHTESGSSKESGNAPRFSNI